MTESEAQALQLLRQMNQKLDRLLEGLARKTEAPSSVETHRKTRGELAEEIAALTPPSARQTDAVELLHADRMR